MQVLRKAVASVLKMKFDTRLRQLAFRRDLNGIDPTLEQWHESTHCRSRVLMDPLHLTFSDSGWTTLNSGLQNTFVEGVESSCPGLWALNSCELMPSFIHVECVWFWATTSSWALRESGYVHLTCDTSDWALAFSFTIMRLEPNQFWHPTPHKLCFTFAGMATVILKPFADRDWWGFLQACPNTSLSTSIGKTPMVWIS